MEDTPARRIERARHFAAQHDPLTLGFERRIGDGHGREQRLRVRVQRRVVERLAVGDLDDLAEVHDGHAVGDVAHDREVVGDEQVRETELRLEVFQQVDDLRLDRDVEGRDRLVADDERGLDGERACDAHALTLSAGELVGIPPRMLRQESDAPQELAHARRALGRVGDDPVHRQGLGDDLPDRHPRVERAVRVLEDHLHLAAHRPQLVLAEGREVAPLEDDLPARRPLELEDAPAGRRLAAARLADEPEGLAAADREAHVVHGTDDAGPPAEEPAADVEVFDEVPNLQEWRVVVHVAAPLRATARSRFAASQHALTWPPPPMGTSLGRSTAQRATWKAQRGAKAHPAPRRVRSGGWPSIGSRRARPGSSRRGTERRRPSVYGWRGIPYSSRAGPRSTLRAAYITFPLSA